MSRKVAEFDALVGDLERLVVGGTNKVAEDQSSSEVTVAPGTSDPIVEEMLPNGVEQAGPGPGDELTAIGVHLDDGSPEGHPNPPTEEQESTLVSPSTKIAAAQADPFMSLLLEVRDEVGITPRQRKAASVSAPIDEVTADIISRKIAQYAADQEYGRRLAASSDTTPLHRKVAEFADQGYSEDQIAGWIIEQGRLAGFNKAAEDLAAVDPSQQAVAELEALVESGEITPEEAVEAAAEIDAALDEGGEEAPMEDGGGEQDPGQAAAEVLLGLVEEGEISEEEALEAAAEIDAELGGSVEGDEDPEAVAAEALAELVESGEISPEEAEEAAIEIDALLSGEASLDDEGGEEGFEDEGDFEEEAEADDEGSDDEGSRKEASGANWWNFKIAARHDVEDVFAVMDHLCERGVLTESQAVEVLNSAQAGDSRKLAAALQAHNSIVDISRITRKLAEDPAMGGDPAAAGGAPAPAAPAPPAPGGAEGGAPGGDPNAAIDQLLGALEQLVALGVVQEDAAVQAVQGMGLIPAEGGAPAPGGAPSPAGGAPMPPAPGGAPAPGGEAPMPPAPAPAV